MNRYYPVLRNLTIILCMILAPLSLLYIFAAIDSGEGLSVTVLSVSMSFIFLGCALILHANDHIPVIYQFSILLLWTIGLLLIPMFLAFVIEEPPASHQYHIMFWLGTPCIVMAATAIIWYRHQMEINEPPMFDPFDAVSQIKRVESAEPPPRSLNVPRCLTVLLVILLTYTLIIDLILVYNG